MKMVVGYKGHGTHTHRWHGVFIEGQPDAMRSHCGLNTRFRFIRVPKYSYPPSCTKCNYAGYKPRSEKKD